MNKFQIIASLCVLLGASHVGHTQTNEPIVIGAKHSFYSKVLGEDREIWVRVPTGYIVDDTTKYPVVYLLDGKNNFLYTAGLLRQLEIRSVPKSILVGIVNTDRTRDLTPPTSDPEELEDGAGGADSFMKMLEDEIFSFIWDNYRVTEYKTVIGHSYGGLFVLYTLAKNTSLFDSYLAISPSLWWDDQKIVDYFDTKLKEDPEKKALLYMTMASERGKMLGGMVKLASVLESQEPPNLRWDYAVHPNEHHGSIPAISTLEGFHFFYKDWHIPSPEFEAYGLAAINQRKERIKKEFSVNWEPENIIYDDLVYDLLENKDFEKAVQLCNQLIDQGKKAVDFHEVAAFSYLELGNEEKARHHFKEAYKINPGYHGTMEMLDSLKINATDLLQPITYSKKELESFVGHYSDGENECLVMLVGDSLKVTLKEHYFTIKDKLVPFSEDQFYIPNNYYTLEFLRESTSKEVTHLNVRETSGWTNKMIKIK